MTSTLPSAFGRPSPLVAWTILVVGLAVWIAAFDIRHATVDVVYSDTWGYMHMVEGFLSGTFDPWEIFRAHNQNRTALLVGALLASAKFDRFNQKNIENLSLLLAFLTLANFLYLTSLLFKGRPQAMGVLALIMSLALFSLAQWENFLLSINFTFFATTAFSVTSIVAMARCLVGDGGERTKAVLFTIAVVASELALFSMGGGVVVWAVNLVQIGLALALFKVRALGYLLVYLAVCAVSIGIYLWGLEAGGSLSFLISHPLLTLAFFVIGSGNSTVGFFSNKPIMWLDFSVGLVLDLTFLFVFAFFAQLPRHEQKRSLVLVSLILLGLMEEVLIAYGRLPLGLSYAATSRYTTLTVVAPVATLMFLTLYASASRACLSFAVLIGAVMLLFAVVADRSELNLAEARHAYLSRLQTILLENRIGPDEARLLDWESLADIQQGNSVLRKYRLSFYRKL